MSHFIITFRIADDGNYHDRYESFVGKAHELSSGAHWDETTSFIAMTCDLTAEKLCDQLYYGSQFLADRDVMVVINLDARVKASKGELKYPHTLTSALGF